LGGIPILFTYYITKTKSGGLVLTGEEKDKFYSNREIYEMLMGEKDERLRLTQELSLTRESIKKYNGLLEKIVNHEERLRTLEDKDTEKEGKNKLWDGIKNYSVWIIGLVTFGYWLAQALGIGG
jgi:hypothetical protein